METFEFILEGPPVSLKAKKAKGNRYQRWIRTVRAAAQARWPPGESPVTSRRIEVTVTNYYTLSPPDVDNILKPILDGLNSVVYVDDAQVYRVISEKYELSDKTRIENTSVLLAEAFEKYTEVLHISVRWEAEE